MGDFIFGDTASEEELGLGREVGVRGCLDDGEVCGMGTSLGVFLVLHDEVADLVEQLGSIVIETLFHPLISIGIGADHQIGSIYSL